MINTTNSF